jgi:hypothetical protein
LINYRLADLILRVSSKDRKATIEKAREAYERYLSLLDHYEILSAADKKLYRTYTETPTTFSTISTPDPNARRAAKIANFKQEKELKKKLEVWVSLFPVRSGQMLTRNSSSHKTQLTSRTTTMPSATYSLQILLSAPIIRSNPLNP